MRADANYRFCTSLEKRFTRKQTERMLMDVVWGNPFSEQTPF